MERARMAGLRAWMTVRAPCAPRGRGGRRHMRMHGWGGVAALATVLVGVSLPSEALACGGFFCSRVPVDQSGENIVFGVDGRRVEAHVQIQYQGAAEKFAWVVPVPSLPQLSIGSPVLFT